MKRRHTDIAKAEHEQAARELRDAAIECDGYEVNREMWPTAARVIEMWPSENWSLGSARGPGKDWRRLAKAAVLLMVFMSGCAKSTTTLRLKAVSVVHGASIEAEVSVVRR